MSTKNEDAQAGANALSIEELTAVLIKHFGYSDGKYTLAVEFQIGVGGVGPPGQILPGAVVGLKSIGLSSAPSDPRAIDAAEISSTAQVPQPNKQRLKGPKKT